MPVRQDTFKLIPTTLVNTTAPRPPMTSKAAKKAYREASRLPRVSKAEQRRIEAAEIARQKKEYEKEKVAAKAKAARDKKLKKEADQRAKRKELGLPEPSRFVRSSQPTIKHFVKSGAGEKRSWEGVDDVEGEDANVRNEDHGECQNKYCSENPAKRIALEPINEDDEFGDFPSLSQADLPTLFADPEDTSRTASIESSPSILSCTRPRRQPVQREADYHIQIGGQAEVECGMAENRLLTGAMLVRTITPAVLQNQSSMVIPRTASNSREKMTANSAGSSLTVSRLQTYTHTPKKTSPAIHTNRLNKLVGERSKSMQHPAVPMTVNRLRCRSPLSEVSNNMAPPPLPLKGKALMSTTKIGAQTLHKLGREHLSVPPPSTLAFLEAHLDDFYPSPSQQVRELLEDIDDVPSNTQIAQEIDVEHDEITPQASPAAASLRRSPAPIENEALHFLSSQDLEISSQDLRDFNTPSNATQIEPQSPSSTILRRVGREVTPAPPTPRSKARFFQEKDDDLLHAALYESLLLVQQMVKGPSPKRSQRALRRTQSAKIEHGGDDYGSDGSDLDPEILALLDDA